MSNFKFHLVTVVGIFLALGLGIFIGSTFTEEGIIVQQRNTIEGMRAELAALEEEKASLTAHSNWQDENLGLAQQWLGALAGEYWQANPVAEKVLLIHNGNFPLELAASAADIVQGTVVVKDSDAETLSALVAALAGGTPGELLQMEGISLEGRAMAPDYILLGLGEEDWELAQGLATSLLEREVPVVALAGEGLEQNLADLVQHPLYASISHWDTSLGLYCLHAVLQGQGGHYGWDNILPPGGMGQ